MVGRGAHLVSAREGYGRTQIRLWWGARSVRVSPGVHPEVGRKGGRFCMSMHVACISGEGQYIG
eukprot:scaffold8783_cov135-Isochrysis_galbana.AAC.1